MLLAAGPLDPTLPVGVSTAIAVGAAVVGFLLALTIVRFAKAVGGVVGAGAALVGASSLLPWASGDTTSGRANFDAWKHNSAISLTKFWTNVGPNDLRWGVPLAVAAGLMFVLGVLPGRFGLLAIIPALLVPYALLYRVEVVAHFKLDVKNVGVGAWAALGGSALVIIVVIIRALQAPSRSSYGQPIAQPYGQPGYPQQYPQPYPYPQQPGYPPPAPYGQPAYGQQPGYEPQTAHLPQTSYEQPYGQPTPAYGQDAQQGYGGTDGSDGYDHGGYHEPPQEQRPQGPPANDGQTQIIQSPLGQPPYGPPREG